MKRRVFSRSISIWFALVGAVFLLGIIVMDQVMKRVFSVEFFQKEIEGQLACKVELDEVKIQWLSLFQPARIELQGLRMFPDKQAWQKRIAESEVNLGSTEEALLNKVLADPFFSIQSLQLDLKRFPLFQKEFQITRIFLQQPEIKLVDLGELGNNVQLKKREEPATDQVEKPSGDERETQQADQPSLVQIDIVKIQNAQLEYVQLEDLLQGGTTKKPLSWALLDADFRVQNLSNQFADLEKTDLEYKGLFVIDKGMDTRLLALDLDGKGSISWQETKAALPSISHWHTNFQLGEDSFLWGEDILADLRKDLEPLAEFGLLTEDWEVSNRGLFSQQKRVRFSGTTERLQLLDPVVIAFDEAWVKLDEQSWLSFDKETGHNFTGRARLPEEINDGAYQKLSEQLIDLGQEVVWQKLETAYFVGEELQIPLESTGSNDKFDVEVSPQPDELISVEDVVEGLFRSFLEDL